MGKILIVGGTKGIGQEIAQLLENRECVLFSREAYSVTSNNHVHYQLDVSEGNFPDIEDLSSIVYCPGTINLKPFRSLKVEDFQNDFDVNFLGAVKVIQHFQWRKFFQFDVVHQIGVPRMKNLVITNYKKSINLTVKIFPQFHHSICVQLFVICRTYPCTYRIY